jgi:hypothetical protein
MLFKSQATGIVVKNESKGVRYIMSKKLAAAGTVLMVLIQAWCICLEAGAEEAKPSIPVVPVQIKATWIWDTTLIITQPKKYWNMLRGKKLI